MLSDRPRPWLVAAERQVDGAADPTFPPAPAPILTRGCEHGGGGGEEVRDEHAVSSCMRGFVEHVVEPEVRVAEANVLEAAKGGRDIGRVYAVYLERGEGGM